MSQEKSFLNGRDFMLVVHGELLEEMSSKHGKRRGYWQSEVQNFVTVYEWGGQHEVLPIEGGEHLSPKLEENKLGYLWK